MNILRQFGTRLPSYFFYNLINEKPGNRKVHNKCHGNECRSRNSGVIRFIRIIAGMQQIAEQTHAKGLRIFSGTLTPFRGFRDTYFTEDGEKTREKVNNWIRTSGVFDGVIDFEHAVADPSNPQKLLPTYDFDHLHPNDAGYKAMADSIDLTIFKK
jgi:lysophospholipase L1-like esterase